MQATYSGADKRLQYLFQNAKNVSFTQTLATGTLIGSLTIDGVATNLYAPNGGGGGGGAVTCTPLLMEGTAIARFTIDNQSYMIYAPEANTVSFTGFVTDEINVVDQHDPQHPIYYNAPTVKVGNLVISNGEDYRLSSDISVVPGKAYYERTDTYSPVTPMSGDNPATQGWYELVQGSYVLTSDQTVVSGKTYYRRSSTYDIVTPQSGDSPQSEGWYELSGTPLPIYAPPALGVVYNSNYNSGILCGTLKVRTIASNPHDDTELIIADEQSFDVIIPSGSSGGSVVSYSQLYPSTGEHIGTITIDGYAQNIYAPSGGGSGNVADVYVDGSSVLDSNHIAQINLTGYATDSELSSAVATLQANFQDGVDRIYEACVRKGSTPASHSLSDVIDAIYAIGGQMEYRDVESTLTMNMRYFGHAKEDD